METIRIVTDISKHVGCGGLMAMSQDAPQYILEHEGLETTVAGAEMVCLRCGERIRSQDQVDTPSEELLQATDDVVPGTTMRGESKV